MPPDGPQDRAVDPGHIVKRIPVPSIFRQWLSGARPPPTCCRVMDGLADLVAELWMERFREETAGL